MFVIALAVLILVAGIEIFLIQVEKWGFATGLVIAGLVAIHLLGILNVPAFIMEHPSQIGICSGLYIAVGVVWSFVKWIWFNLRFRDRFREAREDFVEKYKSVDYLLNRSRGETEGYSFVGLNYPDTTNMDMTQLRACEVTAKLEQKKKFEARPSLTLSSDGTLPEAFHKDFLNFLQYNHPMYAEKPQAREHKSRIVAWMAYWPFSMIGTILNDFVKEIFEFIATRFKRLYQDITDRLFKGEVELK